MLWIKIHFMGWIHRRIPCLIQRSSRERSSWWKPWHSHSQRWKCNHWHSPGDRFQQCTQLSCRWTPTCRKERCLSNTSKTSRWFLPSWKHNRKLDSQHQCVHSKDPELSTHSKKPSCRWKPRGGYKLEPLRSWWP